MKKIILEYLTTFVNTANGLLDNKIISAYSFGSATYEDFHIGYSDLDFFIIVDKELTEDDFKLFHQLRYQFKKSENPYLSVLEGEIISYQGILNIQPSNTIYWGSKKDSFNKHYQLSGFSLRNLIDNGYLLYGKDLRKEFNYPTHLDMMENIHHLVEIIKIHAVKTQPNIHSIDWLFLISQSLYYLYTKQVTGKTQAAKWVFVNIDAEWLDTLMKAVDIRENPHKAKRQINKIWLEDLGKFIQMANNTLEKTFQNYQP